MDDPQLAATIVARLEGDVDLARTLVNRPSKTIEPPRPVSAGGMHALEALRALGASLHGKIDVHRTLGEGGMGVVHLATQATLGRHVAVKTLRAGVGDLDATLRILREAWVTGALEHPNVVPVYDVGVDAAGSPIIVMKRIDGRHWGELIRAPEEMARRFSATDPVEWNLRILASVCNAAHFAHSRGILHRDLKPENVMIGEFGEVYVLDWGIAISLREDPSGRLPPASLAKEIAGTPQYMAPEMLLGDPSAYSPRTDVYLLGAILFEIFGGAPPHEGDNLNALITDVLLSQPRFPASFPVEARLICAKAMARDPADRFESAEELRLAIDEYLRHRGSRKLAREAQRSLTLLTATIEKDPPGEERTLAVANLLGECRFGYRAALSAWADNAAARQGLDRALLAVVDYELAAGDANAAATLLREVSAPPASLVARIDAALKARADEDERLHKMDQDLDPRVGSRTRTLLGGGFGGVWTVSPLLIWCYVLRGGTLTHRSTIVAPLVFLLIACAAYVWARESMTKTLLNRRLAMTFGLSLVAQFLLGVVAWQSGLSPVQGHVMLFFAWALVFTLLAVWAEGWFGLPAAACAVSFVTAATFRGLTYPLMSVVQLVFTIVLVRVWFPRQDLERIQERRMELRKRAKRWFRGPT